MVDQDLSSPKIPSKTSKQETQSSARDKYYVVFVSYSDLLVWVCDFAFVDTGKLIGGGGGETGR